MDKPKIICYCGSSKFIEEFKMIEYESVVNGFIALLPTFMYEKTLYTPTLDYRNKADQLHLRKIDICDEVVVINVNGYFGPSTRNEIEYALSIGKPIRFLYENATRI